METIIEYMGGRSMSTFLSAESEQPVAVLKQFLQAVMGSSMVSHLDEHGGSSMADQSVPFGSVSCFTLNQLSISCLPVFSDFVNCTGCCRLVAIALFACGRELDQWSKSKEGPLTLLDFLA